MASVTKVLFAVFVTTVLSSANGQIYDQPPEPIETEYPVDILFHVNDDGVIRNLTTGLVVTKQQAIASLETPYPILGGIILGGLGGGAVAYGQGGGTREILLAAGAGGIAGYYSALATIGGSATLVVYGPASVGATYVGSLIVVTKPPAADCGTNPPPQGCKITTK